ncbi:MAG: RES family NAD+ phosphorylase [Devosia sp.]
MRFVGRAYRAHDPRWAFSPASGDGAAITGGRFNHKGAAALYLSLDPVGAIIEVEYGLPGRMPPLTLCQYDIDCDDVVDLSATEGRAAAGISLEAIAGAWKDLPKAPSREVATVLRLQGAAGILVPSFAARAAGQFTNLVLWDWGPERPHQVIVFDPSGRLPKNQLSWT